LQQLERPGFYAALDKVSDKLARGLQKAAADAGQPVSVSRVGSMLGLFFTDFPVQNFSDAKTSDLKKFAAYYKGMRERGVYLAPSQYEALFVSAAHTDEQIDATVAAAAEVLKLLG
jgi:glutamate-1-semialdehyde 2,1-aminomutase